MSNDRLDAEKTAAIREYVQDMALQLAHLAAQTGDEATVNALLIAAGRGGWQDSLIPTARTG